MYRATKLRLRRKVKQRKRQVEDIGSNAEEHFDRHFIRRIVRLFNVRRFVLSWLMLVIVLGGITITQLRALNGYYQQLRPIPGGIYTEGIVGSLTNANPLFASSMVDASVARLVFSGLFRYDDQNRLVGDLAEEWTLDAASTTYTIEIRSDVYWHDGRPFTVDDVLFTFETAQNPDVKSPLFQVWREVTAKKIDEHTISLTLKAPFAPFIYSLTTGIIPKHLLGDVEPSQLRSVAFNTNHPIGTGPFRWQTLEITGDTPETREQSIGFRPYERYHFGKPKLDALVQKTFLTQDRLFAAFEERKVDALVGVDTVPEGKSVRTYETPLTGITMAFFLTSDGVTKDSRVRAALVQSVDVPELIKHLGYPVVRADEPFLRSSSVYDPAYRQTGKNTEAASQQLDAAGWVKDATGQRIQGEESLQLRVFGQNTADNKLLSKQLQQAWSSLGIKVEVVLQDEQDIQATIENRSYDVLLNAVSLGLDPDVYAFWHSSQADPRALGRLNFSNYASPAADRSLDEGRTRIDPTLRAAKYKPFLQAWKNDNPALALFQPRFLYITRGDLFGYEPSTVNSSTDRFNNVHNWMIRQANVPITTQ